MALTDLRDQLAATVFVVTSERGSISMIVTFGGAVTYIVRDATRERRRVATLEAAVQIYNEL